MPNEDLTRDAKLLLKQSVKNNFEEVASKISLEGTEVDEGLAEKGVPFEKIIRVSQQKNTSFIVAGSLNKGKADPFRLSITIEKFIRKNQVPLWCGQK